MMAWKPLMTWRWLLAAVLVIAASATCIALGFWQFHRFEARSASVAAVTRNYDADPVAIANILESPTDTIHTSEDYTVVEATGHYCDRPECELYVRNRTLGQSVGFWQLVPFFTDDGEVLMIVRGWVDSAPAESAPATRPAIPDGTLTLMARLRPAEPHLSERAQVTGQLQSVNAADVEAQAGSLPGLYTNAYGQLAAETAADGTALATPRQLEKPETTRGPHLSYAFQWWVFSIFFPVGFAVSARRTIRDADDEDWDGSAETTSTPSTVQGGGAPAFADPATPAGGDGNAGRQQDRHADEPRRWRKHAVDDRYPSARGNRPQRKRRPTNEDEEDAFLDERFPQ